MKIQAATLYEAGAHAQYMQIMGADMEAVNAANAAFRAGDATAQPWRLPVREPMVDSDVTDERGTYQPVPEAMAIVPASGRLSHLSVIRAMAWSAANAMPYQQQRNAAFADAWKARLVSPNTPGQGKGVRALSDDERYALRNGDFGLVGRAAGRSAQEAGAYQSPDAWTHGQTVVMAESQGPSLIPGILAAAPENAPISDVVMISPVGAQRRPGALDLQKDLIATGGRGMKQYRELNPDWMSTKRVKDTNVTASVATQFTAHVRDYPAGMARGTLGAQLVQTLKERSDLRPDIHVLMPALDGVYSVDFAHGDLIHGLRAAIPELRKLGVRVNEVVLPRHHHAVTEYVPYVAATVGRIIRPELYR